MKLTKDGDSLGVLDGWGIVLIGVLASLLLVVVPTARAPRAGSELTIELTVVPGDKDTLSCDADGPIEGHRCMYENGKKLPFVERPLRPYVTTGHELVLLTGVFEAPAVTQWVDQSRHAGRNDRVTLRCNVEMLTRSASAGVRFGKSGPFSREKTAMAGRVVGCEVK